MLRCPITKRFIFLAAGLLAGCGTSPSDTEATRAVALEYLGGNVGTAGPFSRHASKDLDVLSPKDRADALALLERGAVGFQVFEPGAGGVTRIILVHRGHVVGDFRAAKPHAAPEPSSPTATTQKP
jgi:hypothetical protein